MSQRNLLSPVSSPSDGAGTADLSNRSPSPNPVARSPSSQNLQSASSSFEQPRRTSFGFLRSSTRRSPRNGFPQAVLEEAPISKEVPILPHHVPLPSLQSGLQSINLSNHSSPPSRINTAIGSNPSILSSNQSARAGSYSTPSAPPTAIAESIAPLSPVGSRISHTGSTFAGAQSSRRRRRKDPTPFNVLVLGTKSSGRTSFVDLLRYTLGSGKLPSPSSPTIETQSDREDGFTAHYLEKDFSGERVGITIWDSPALEPDISKFQISQLSSFLESRFEQRFIEEQKVIRSPNIQETHIHCVFLLLDPSRLDANIKFSQKGNFPVDGPSYLGQFRGSSRQPNLVGLLDDQIDIALMEALSDKTVVIPIIAKADTITRRHANHLKEQVSQSLSLAKISPLSIFRLVDLDSSDDEDEDEDDEDDLDQDGGPAQKANSDTDTVDSSQMPASDFPATVHTSRTPLPFSIISPESYDDNRVGREFSWGFADPFDPEHCDFEKLVDFIFSRRRAALREASTRIWYEKWRTARLRATRAVNRTAITTSAVPPPASSRTAPVQTI